MAEINRLNLKLTSKCKNSRIARPVQGGVAKLRGLTLPNVRTRDKGMLREALGQAGPRVRPAVAVA